MSTCSFGSLPRMVSMVRVVALVGLAVLTTGCPSRAGRRVDDLPLLDRGADFAPASREAVQALRLVRKAHAISTRIGEQIWPGYRFHERPLVLFSRRGEAYLVGGDVVPAGSERVEDPRVRLPDVVRLRLAPGAINPNQPFKQEARVAGVSAFAIRFGDRQPGGDWFRLLVHEVFHVHQREVWGQIEPETPACRYPVEDVEQLVLAELEQRALAAALPHLEEQPRVLTALAEVRALRDARRALPSGEKAGAIERHEERLEGAARYVELRYAVAAGVLGRAELVTELRRALSSLRLANAHKWRYYSTGAALGLLLDRTPEESERRWTSRIDEGEDFDTLLAERAPSSPHPAERVERSRFDHGGAESRVRLSAEVTRLLRQERAWLARLDAGPGRRVTVHMHGPAGGTYQNRGPTVVLEDCRRLATGIQSYVVETFGLQILARPAVPGKSAGGGRPVLMGGAGTHRTLVFRAPPPHRLRIDGEPAPLGNRAAGPWERRFHERLESEHPEWHVRFEGRGTVAADERGDLTYTLIDADADGPPVAGTSPKERCGPHGPGGDAHELAMSAKTRSPARSSTEPASR